jgi:hypothetical protein
MSWFSDRFNGNGNGKYASMRTQPPLARSEDLVVEDLDDEVLVYDRRNARAHCLTGTAAQVWRACDGEADVAEISVRLDLDTDTVNLALAELESNALLDGPAMSNGSTRRQFSITAVKAGAAIGAAPMIYSIVAPTPAAAITPSVSQCLFYSGKSCSSCSQICGCCCCCEGCSSATVPACKICYPTSLCNVNYTAPGNPGGGCHAIPGVSGSCSSGPHCSDTAPNSPPAELCAPFGNGSAPKCCFPPCNTSTGCPSLHNCGSSGGTAQPCNCTGVCNPCGSTSGCQGVPTPCIPIG